ncbi:MAG TPA: hypothetical protein VMT35_16505, partial [Ignavibacteriaceae bacterium]|nr:hypothetical protein [Ignavibacteriaceae bacterium]
LKIFVPINVVIDSFNVYEKTGMFSEKGNFDCWLRFFYPTQKDSIASIQTSTHLERSGMDVTNSLEDLIYEGVVECTKQFYAKFKDNSDYSVAGNDITPDIIINSPEKTVFPPDTASKPQVLSSIGMTVLQGSKIKSGFQLSYQEHYIFKNPHFAGGFGFCGSYYDIENKKDFLEGSFFSLNSRYSLRYFLSENQKGPYFSGGLKLSFGTEKINYGYGNSKTNFFVGPTLEEVFGISIARKVFLEGGAFQIKHFGSDLMPDDLGYLFALYVGI